MALYLYYLIIGAPGVEGVVPEILKKKWLLIAWKCTQMTLYFYYLFIGAPGEGWVVPEFSKIGFKCMEMFSDDIVSLLFDHRSPWRRMGSARIFKNWL